MATPADREQSKRYLEQALREMRKANIHLANARDALFGVTDAGFVAGELGSAKAAVQVVITHTSRKLHSDFPPAAE